MPRALELRPGFADAHLNLGQAHKAAGRLDDAITSYRKALDLDPNLAEAHSSLGNAYRLTGDVKAALDNYRLAVKIDPTLVQVHYSLGIIKLEQGRLEDSLEDLKSAVALAPDHVEAIASIGEVLEALGQNDEASAWYRKIIDVHVDLSLPIMDQRARHFALGRIHDRLGEFDTAFAHFKSANDIWLEHQRRTDGVYSPAAWEAIIGSIIGAFPREGRAGGDIKGNPSRLPVFVLGMPRSGTTLVEQILASHSEVHGAGELPDIPRVAERISGNRNWADAVGTLDNDRADAIANEYLDRLREIAPETRRVVNKLPMNFLYLGLIRTLFPAAPIIHCRRDPLDVCLSNYFGNFAEPKDFTNDLSDLGHFFKLYQRLMAYWEKIYPGTIFHNRLRFLDRRSGGPQPRIDFLLRTGVAGTVPVVSRDGTTRCNREPPSGAPAAIQKFGSTVAKLRPLSGAASGRFVRRRSHRIRSLELPPEPSQYHPRRGLKQ